MESFKPTDIVLVTGANGHIGSHIVYQLLNLPAEQRPKVRATVRKETSAAGLKQAFPNHITTSTLELTYIPDITVPNIFNDALRDITHICHVASPIIFDSKNWEEDLLKPAIHGTTSLLTSALSCPTLKAVVITSSIVTVMDHKYGLRPGYTYTSADWHPITYEQAADPNLDLTQWPEIYRPAIPYIASKTLAERAAWELYEENKPGWWLSTVLPAYVGGPSVLPLERGAESLSPSQQLIWRVAQSKPGEKLLESDSARWVDVRDVAGAHLKALLTRKADGERFIVAPYQTTYGRMAEVLRGRLGLDCASGEVEVDSFDMDMRNCETVLGMKVEHWVKYEDMLCDTIKQLLEVQA